MQTTFGDSWLMIYTESNTVVLTLLFVVMSYFSSLFAKETNKNNCFLLSAFFLAISIKKNDKPNYNITMFQME